MQLGVRPSCVFCVLEIDVSIGQRTCGGAGEAANLPLESLPGSHLSDERIIFITLYSGGLTAKA